MTIYQAKVTYDSASNGDKVTETYLLRAFNLTDAEAMIAGAVSPKVRTNSEGIEIKSITNKRFDDFLQHPADADTDVRYYVVKTESETESGATKRYTTLISAPDLDTAYRIATEKIYYKSILSIVEHEAVDYLHKD